MKQLFLCFAICVFSFPPVSSFGQNSHSPAPNSLDSTIVWEVGISFAQITRQPSRLFYARLKVFATDRFSLGIHGAILQRRTMETFGQDVIEPQLGFGEIGFVTAYNFVNTKRFSLGGEVVTGYASASLSDRAVTETQFYAYAVDGVAFVTEQEVPSVVTRNRYFQFRPELTACFRFNRYIGIQVGGGYNFLLGKTRFAKTADFDGWVARAGVLLVIPSDEQGN
ncbi:MAG: hypothetical protein K9J37_02320 [Saprospiraceae bacterium]|nr:hypothetical protein [Saprospiraceae bacterium]MCF8248715.1 hypothetical protein [Saprospiraceae bacterium]MCF8278795.1 hypothetical protein [Bacteroidales bacterium]MCF8310595.1 hypothetical protein [Saprospiraceae bacterium]MCF8439154.1 hypothetical protein [Saprospiraceae bacterium]